MIFIRSPTGQCSASSKASRATVRSEGGGLSLVGDYISVLNAITCCVEKVLLSMTKSNLNLLILI